jgi:hypothetical protein
VRLTTLEEVARDEADALVISEYMSDGRMLAETIGELRRERDR